MDTSSTSGFTLIEVLIATVLVGLIIGSVVISSVNLSSVNARAQLQSLEATAARAVALRYATTPPDAGTALTGPVSDVIALNDLSSNESDLMSRFVYVLSIHNTITTLNIHRSDLHPDPQPLIITAQIDN